MLAFYNEIEAFSAARIRARIAAGLVCPGYVDERDVRDIVPTELADFGQVHLFAGGGAWSYALRRGEWPDSRNVWTLSCPCQPFSAAGRRGGVADERHLWPSAFHFVDVHRPDAIFGEQVASKDGLAWLDLVCADLEGAGYAVRAVDTCSAGVGAPNIRQRLYFAAERLGDADRTVSQGRSGGGNGADQCAAWPGMLAGRLARPDGRERDGRSDAPGGHDCRGQDPGRPEGDGGVASCGGAGGLAVSPGKRRGEARADFVQQRSPDVPSGTCDADRPGPVNGFWRDADWLWCRDGRWRPVEPGLEPLAPGLSDRVGRRLRVGRLREHGNAINAEVAAAFVADCLADGM